MAKDTDILINETGDIVFDGRDFAIGDSTRQNQYLILTAHKGEYKEHPLIGAGIEDMLHDEGSEVFWKRHIAEELKRDGMSVEEVKVNNGTITIKAEYR